MLLKLATLTRISFSLITELYLVHERITSHKMRSSVPEGLLPVEARVLGLIQYEKCAEEDSSRRSLFR